MLQPPFLYDFDWIRKKKCWSIQYALVYSMLFRRWEKADYWHQSTMSDDSTHFLSNNTLQCRLNAWLWSLLLVPSCLHILYFTYFSAWLSCYATFAPIDSLIWENPSMISMGFYFLFAVCRFSFFLMWLSNSYFQAMNCTAFTYTRKLCYMCCYYSLVKIYKRLFYFVKKKICLPLFSQILRWHSLTYARIKSVKFIFKNSYFLSI